MKSVTILGTTVHNISAVEARNMLFDSLVDSGKPKQYVVTPNPEILLEAHRNQPYRDVLNDATLSVPDGFGLRLFTKISHRVAGSDLAASTLYNAGINHKTVLCIVREDGLSSVEEVRAAMSKRAPEADVHVVGVPLLSDYSSHLEEWKSVGADLLLVGVGFPQQEKIVTELAPQMPSVRVAIGIGGTFDFWTGKAVRAPRFMRAIGLEWLWRVIRQPSRIGRIFRAVVVFPVTVLLHGRK